LNAATKMITGATAALLPRPWSVPNADESAVRAIRMSQAATASPQPAA
jgi:hypothetical protein